MKINSTNIAKPTTIIWNGKKIKTGIYKTPTNIPIYLGKETVKNDEVSDRKVHGGIYKACYLFSENHYDYWKNLYPNLDWNYGMFGENLTVKNLDETKLFIGDVFEIGDALVQVTQPREPCFKFGVKFGSQRVIQQFINYGFPGTYVRVLREGLVQTGNKLKCIEHDKSSISICDFFQLLYSKNKNPQHINAVLNHKALPQKKRALLLGFAKNHKQHE
ncbi:MOSC domain-containing protein [Hwangdonia seohaensis]|uniref:MOSC domain-containing protein n=1 Tax=Hwangdonia seohaensis TaxID=1240727 RepID=A0ABW3RE05_9FLAO|nr:MOSC domain-containing protein [Hwangdonia seohaensis]